MRTAQQIAVEITDAIEEFEQHHEAAGTALASGGVTTNNLDIIRESKEKHIAEFLGDMSFVNPNGEPLKRKDIEQHIASILAGKTHDEVETFLQQLHNDVSNARTLHHHIGK